MWAADPRSFSHGQLLKCDHLRERLINVLEQHWKPNSFPFFSNTEKRWQDWSEIICSILPLTLWQRERIRDNYRVIKSHIRAAPPKFRPAVREMESGMLLQMSMPPMCLLKSMPSGHRMRNVIANGLRLRDRQMERHATPAWIDWQTFNTNISVVMHVYDGRRHLNSIICRA